MSDPQKARVYGSEQQVRRVFDLARTTGSPLINLCNSQMVLPDEVLFGSLAGAEKYLHRVQSTDWYTERWPDSRPVSVRQRKGNQKAHYQHDGVIALHDTQQRGQAWAMRELVVLHELAHHVTRPYEAHGAEFCGAFIHLVSNAMGGVAGLLLMHTFHTGGCAVNHAGN